MTVLLVYHEKQLRQLYHDLLKTQDAEITYAEDIASALLELINHDINLILLDGSYKPAEISRFLNIIHHKPDWQSLPIILTNYHHSIAELGDIAHDCNLHHFSLITHSPDQLLQLIAKLTINSS